ncbi:hypothetical protein BDR26DRAFT_851724 [Obelidium mucronatum]|nr:hypothetical protein BDR26DRAFT_851724 [Obelidium mucronatum]
MQNQHHTHTPSSIPSNSHIRRPFANPNGPPRTPLASAAAARRSVLPNNPIPFSLNSSSSSGTGAKPKGPRPAANPFVLDCLQNESEPFLAFPSLGGARKALQSESSSTAPTRSLTKPSTLFETPPKRRILSESTNNASFIHHHSSTSLGAHAPSLVPPVATESRTGLSNAVVDVFGFGSFSDVFITDQDLEAAKEKLPESEIKSNQEMLNETLDRLLEWEVVLQEEINSQASTVKESSVLNDTGNDSVLLCVNYIALGTGCLSFSFPYLRWTGNLPIRSAQGVKNRCVLEWNRNALSDVRIKTLDDAEPLLPPPVPSSNTAASEESENGISTALSTPDFEMQKQQQQQHLLLVTAQCKGNYTLFLQFQFSDLNVATVFRDALNRHIQHVQQQEVVVTGTTTTEPDDLMNSTDKNDSRRQSCERVGSVPQMIDDIGVPLNNKEKENLLLEYKLQREALLIEKEAALKQVNDKYESLLACLEVEHERKLEVLLPVVIRCQDEDTNRIDIPSDVGTLPTASVNSYSAMAVECGICCDDVEYYELQPCKHRMCKSCFQRLSTVTTAAASSSSSEEKQGWTCPWDRFVVESSTTV